MPLNMSARRKDKMAAPLERLDQIRDALIASGIGSSRLAQQKIERQNLPDLSRELATSQAVRESQQRTRLSNIRRQSLRGAQAASLPRGTAGSTRGLTTIRNLSGPNSDGKFAVEVAGASNIPNFKSLQEATDFLKKRNLLNTAVFAGPGQLQEGSTLIKDLETLGIPLVSGQQTGSPTNFLNKLRPLAQQAGLSKNPQQVSRRQRIGTQTLIKLGQDERETTSPDILGLQGINLRGPRRF